VGQGRTTLRLAYNTLMAKAVHSVRSVIATEDLRPASIDKASKGLTGGPGSIPVKQEITMEDNMNNGNHSGLSRLLAPETAVAGPQMHTQFVAGTANDSRQASPFGDASEPNLEALQKLAQERHPEACGRLDELRRSLTTLTGYPVQIQIEPLSFEFDSSVEIAPLVRRDYHLIRCSSNLPPQIQTHAITHELAHIQLEFEASVAGRARRFFQTARTREFVAGLYREQKALLRCLGAADSGAIDQAVAQDAGNLLAILFNRAIDIAVESWIHRHVPCLSAAQILAYHYFQATLPSPEEILCNPSLLRPRSLDIVSLALNGVEALVQDSFFGGATALAEPYRNTEVYPLASKLWQHWQTVSSSLGPGDEYDLADAFGKIVGLSKAYESKAYSRQGPRTMPSAPGGGQAELARRGPSSGPSTFHTQTPVRTKSGTP
jgi:hypothetical protein